MANITIHPRRFILDPQLTCVARLTYLLLAADGDGHGV